MLIQEVITDCPPGEVIRLAREFFLTRFSPYGADIESESERHIAFSIEAGELVIGVGREGEKTLVRGSTSRIHHELAQFLMFLNVPEEVRQNLAGPGVSGAG
jgi:hypothetical protein